jgi:hypothetical protein
MFMGNRFILLGRWIISHLITRQVIIIEVRVIEVIIRQVGFLERMVGFIRFFLMRFSFISRLMLVFY